MEIPENLPSTVWAAAWAELYKVFSERLDQPNVDLMESVLNSTIANAQREIEEAHGRT